MGFVLAHIDKNYLWISSLGLVINWYGDSLDGTLARVRNAQRPVYGFFIDHTLDAVTICIMCIGAWSFAHVQARCSDAGISGLFGSFDLYVYLDNPKR